MIDSHTHLNFEAFAADWQEVVDRAVEAGVEQMVVVGTDIASSNLAVKMAEQRKELFAAVGTHPHHARQISDLRYQMSEIRRLAEHPRVVAIGEIGLDYHKYQITRYKIQDTNTEWEKTKNLQKQLLGAQIQIAKEVKKPVILHSREAGNEVLDVIEHFCKNDGKLPNGVWHCFDGSKKYVKRILERGFYVSFTGNVTYVPDRAEVAKQVPLDKLLLETDCPYMTVNREARRSEPKDVKIIGQFHARARGVEKESVAKQTTTNAQRLFKLKSL